MCSLRGNSGPMYGRFWHKGRKDRPKWSSAMPSPNKHHHILLSCKSPQSIHVKGCPRKLGGLLTQQTDADCQMWLGTKHKDFSLATSSGCWGVNICAQAPALASSMHTIGGFAVVLERLTSTNSIVYFQASDKLIEWSTMSGPLVPHFFERHQSHLPIFHDPVRKAATHGIQSDPWSIFTSCGQGLIRQNHKHPVCHTYFKDFQSTRWKKNDFNMKYQFYKH